MIDGLHPIVTGKSSFRGLVESGTYVDKTAHIVNMIDSGITHYNLSRPEGFGKTTLLDTLEALFKGEKELFKGLCIEDKRNFEDTYPVIRINMKELTEKDVDGNKKILMERLGEYANQYGIEDKDLGSVMSPSSVYGNLVEEIHRKTGKKVVVLVDDFDALLLKNIQSKEWDAYCRLVYKFLSKTKPRDEHIRFFFMTGFTRFIANEFCCDFNNVIVLSDDPDYVDLCGYTDEEIDKYFTPCFEKHFKEEGITSDEEKAGFRDRVREYYGGYRFTLDSDVTIYNPTSINRFVESGCVFARYWTANDPDSLAEKLIRPYDIIYQNEKYFALKPKSLTVIDLQEHLDSWLVLYMTSAYLKQVGYLTLDKEIEFGFVELVYPNREAKEIMTRLIGIA